MKSSGRLTGFGAVEIKVEEEQSKNWETRHTSETAGYMIFSRN